MLYVIIYKVCRLLLETEKQATKSKEKNETNRHKKSLTTHKQ